MHRLPVFCFLLCFSISAYAQTAKMSVFGKAQKSFDEIVSKRDANGRICAGIQVISEMDSLSYDSYNGVVDVNIEPGHDLVYLSPGERMLEILKRGYKPLKIILSEYGIQLRSREVWKIEIEGEAKIGDLLLVTIFVDPADAAISVGEKTILSGKAVELSKGNHKLKITKERFHTIEKNITISKDEVAFKYALIKINPESIIIRSKPTEAEIYIDNFYKGDTDRSFSVYPRKYHLKLAKSGFFEVIDTITVAEGEDNIFIFNLTKNTGSLRLKISPLGTTVLLNKKDYSNRSNIELSPGVYRIEISKRGYIPQSETVIIELEEKTEKTYNLIAKSAN